MTQGGGGDVPSVCKLLPDEREGQQLFFFQQRVEEVAADQVRSAFDGDCRGKLSGSRPLLQSERFSTVRQLTRLPDCHGEPLPRAEVRLILFQRPDNRSNRGRIPSRRGRRSSPLHRLRTRLRTG